jgi:hypothetical protein
MPRTKSALAVKSANLPIECGTVCESTRHGSNEMISVGYMAKRIARKPDWLNAENVVEVYSVSHCISDNFANYFPFWKHNGYWLFNHPNVIQQLASENRIDMSGLKFFYYEVHERQYDEEKKSWTELKPEASFLTDVCVPTEKQLEGYDVVSFRSGTSAEHSPLSCNNLAEAIPVNPYCLLQTFEEARAYLESGRFHDSEPGPFRIFAVYSLPEISTQSEPPTT